MTAAGRRVLFTAAGGHGHLQPLLPLAERAARAGHAVMVAAAGSLRSHVVARGLAFAAAGPDLVPVHGPLRVQETDHERAGVARHFVSRLGPPRAQAVLDLCRSWRPDVVVRDEADFGAAVAAEAAGLPHAAVVVLAAGGFVLPRLVEEPLARLAAPHGVDPDGTGLLHRHLTLTPFPPSFRHPDHPLLGRTLAYRVPVPPAAPHRTLDGRTAFVTLGTVFNTESGDLLRTAALGAAADPTVRDVLVTTGEHLDPASLGPLPAHVSVHRFVDQDALLARSDVVVSHAGSGTVLGALRRGLPTVALPLGADQHLNAERLHDLDLGRTLPADAATPSDVSAAVAAVLACPRTRDALTGVRDQLDALADADEAVHEVVALAG